MSTFLELCQTTARDSGTVSDLNAPATTAGQTGRLLRFVHWTREAYNDVQRRRDDWRWLREEFSGNTIAGTRRYDDAAMGVTKRFSHWIYNDADDKSFSVYKTADGRSDEGFLSFIPWMEFRRRCLTGDAATETGKPSLITVDPQDKLALHPIPDDDYTISGEYYKAPQVLEDDADVPEMPARYHDVIPWRALVLMGTFDEAFEQMPLWQQFFRERMDMLEAQQTPRIGFSGPLA